NKYKFPPYFDMFINALLLGSSYKERQNSLAANMLINPDLTQFKSLAVLKKHEKKLIAIGYEEAVRVIEQNPLK
ncbi:MAG: hypothetical protein ABI370_05820, partial [Gammaproteobacteria bacterium]